MNDKDTIVAICSGVGGSITVIRISGKDSLNIGNLVWKSEKTLAEDTKGRFLLGKIIPDDSGVGETAFAVFMKGPNTFTGEDVVELHAHGGAFNSRRILKAVINHGARQAVPGEFTYRAFINGKIDLTQAEAVCDLINAGSNMAVHLAEKQMDGVLGRKIKSLRTRLADVMIECETRIDFPEEELDFQSKEELGKEVSLIQKEMLQLYETRLEGKIIREGIRVVIAGRPNTGKSSLMNLLLGYDRAITTDIPGTTRDTLEEFVNIRGIPVKLIDTAGLRNSDNIIENIGIKKTMSSLETSQIVLWLLDAAISDLNSEVSEMEKYLNKNKNTIVIWNKSDLLDDMNTLPSTGYDTVVISVKNETGIKELLDVIEKKTWNHPHEKEPDLAISQRHAEDLKKTLSFVPDVLQNLSHENWELAANSLRQMITFLGNITGEDATLDIYESIFSKFCIGK